MNLTPEEIAKLNALGYGGQPDAVSGAPAAPPALPAASMAPPAPPAPPVVPGVVQTPRPQWGTHLPPGERAPSASGVSADQTFGMQPGAGAGANPMAPPAPPDPLKTVTSGASTTKGIHLSKETKAAEADWLKTQAEARAAKDAAFQQSRDAEAKGLQDEASLIRGNAAAAAIEGDENQARLDVKRAHVAKMFDDVANDRTDPDHWWHSRDTLGKIGAAISMIAGGFVSGFRGGPNEGAELVTQAIDRDIAAQRDAHEARKEGAQAKLTLYNLAAQQLHTAEERHAAARAAGLDAARLEIKKRIAQSQDPLGRAKLLEGDAALARETTQTLASLDEKTQDRTTVHSSSTTQTGGPQQGELAADRIVRGPDGRMYMAPDAKTAQALREKTAVVARLKGNLAKVNYLLEQGAGPLTENRATMQPVKADIVRDWSFLNGEKLRQVPDSKKLVEDTIGDPESWTDWHGAARMKALGASLDPELGASFQAAGLVPLSGELTYGVGTGGKPVAVNTGLPNVAPHGKGHR